MGNRRQSMTSPGGITMRFESNELSASPVRLSPERM
jgi:hypothetical protein